MSDRAQRQRVRAGVLGLAMLLLAGRAGAEILRATWIPNRLMPQGQVQVVRDGGAVNVHVLLHTRWLDQVVRAIEEKESAHWPPDHPDTTAYIKTLRLARADLATHPPRPGREALEVAFRLGDDDAHITWSTGDITTDSDGRLVLNTPRILRTLTPGRAYLHRNAALILADSFAIPLEDAQRWLDLPPDAP